MKLIRGIFTASVVWMLVVMIAVIPVTGCTASQVDSVVSKISTYLPTVLSLLNEAITIYSAVGTSGSVASVSSPLTVVQADLANLQKPLADYLAATSSSAKTTNWTNIEALVDTATTDADTLLQIAAVKNTDTQATGVIIISSLDAAVHIIDGFVSSAQSTATVQTKLAKRTVKLKTVSQHWSPQDQYNVSKAFGAPYSVVMARAEALGF